jgi:hypothetical protein
MHCSKGLARVALIRQGLQWGFDSPRKTAKLRQKARRPKDATRGGKSSGCRSSLLEAFTGRVSR